MKTEDYTRYCEFFTGKADEVFKRKYIVDPSGMSDCKEAFRQIETYGKKPKVTMSCEAELLKVIKGKAAYNFLVKQISDQIKLAHKEKWVAVLNSSVDFADEKYKMILRKYLGFDETDEIFEKAWKQAKLSP